MRTLIVLLLGLSLLSACGNGAGSAGSSTGPTASVVESALRDRFLVDHNAAFNDGRTFRWVPPIPIFIGTGEPAIDDFLLAEFVAWEAALAGAGGTPFYEPQGMARRPPRRGIFFAIADLPGRVVGVGDPFFEQPARAAGESTLVRQLRKHAMRAGLQHVHLPLIRSTGEIETCLIVLDVSLADASDNTLRAVVRHEVGHCLGFIGHVARGLMKPTCCALNFTADVTRTMRRLYTLDPGTVVTR
jgi:hypothetical protein